MHKRAFSKLIKMLVSLLVILMVDTSPAGASNLSTISLVSFFPNGQGVDGYAHNDSALSADGRIAVFSSSAELVPGYDNDYFDVYAYDKSTNKIELISIGIDGQPADFESGRPTVSADGRYVAYWTAARNLPGENMRCIDFQPCSIIVVHDRVTKKNKAANVDSQGQRLDAGQETPAISAHGQFVAFSSMSAVTPKDTNNSRDILVRDMNASTTTIVSVDNYGQPGNWASHEPSISGNGKFITFTTGSRLVAPDTNGTEDIYIYFLQLHSIMLLTTADDGRVRKAPSGDSVISTDGRFVAFYSGAQLVAKDTNKVWDIYVHDLIEGTRRRVSVASNGTPANGFNYKPSISGNGRFIAFASDATNLVAADTNERTDVFVHDRFAGVTRRVSVAAHNGPQAIGGSYGPSISDDGKSVLFSSFASNLYPGPTHGTPLYLAYNPVADIPFYDDNDIFDIF
jgi:hypothetical protein